MNDSPVQDIGKLPDKVPVVTTETQVVKPPEKKIGPNETITEDQFRGLVHLVEETGELLSSLHTALIPKSTYYDYLERHPDKSEVMELAKRFHVIKAKNVLHRALESKDEKVQVDSAKFILTKYDKEGNVGPSFTPPVQTNTQVNIITQLRDELTIKKVETKDTLATDTVAGQVVEEKL